MMMEEEGGGGGGDPLCGLCSTPHIRTATLPLFIRDSLFVFHKVFQVSLKDCVTLTTQRRNLMSLCPTCTQLVKDGLSIAKDMDILEGRLANVQTQLREQMKELDLRRVKNREKLMGGGQAQGNGGGVDENEDYEVDDDGAASGIGIIRSIFSASTPSSRLNSNAESTVTLGIGPEGKHEESEISAQAYEDPLQIVYEDCNYGKEQQVDGKDVGRRRVPNDYEVEDVEECRGNDEDLEYENEWNKEQSSSSRPKRRIRVPSKLREDMECSFFDDDDKDDDYNYTPPIRKSKIEGRKDGKWMIKNNSCLLCDEKFENPRHLGFHYSSIHPNTKDSGWPCNKCSSTFEKKGGLYHHRMTVHENLHIQVYHGRYKRKKSSSTCVCLLCEKSFPNKRCIALHYKAEHPNPEWTCPVCAMDFQTRVHLYNHKRLEHSSFHGTPEEDETEEFVEMQGNGSSSGDETETEDTEQGSRSSEPVSKKSRPERHIRTPAKLREPVESSCSPEDDEDEDDVKVDEDQDDDEYGAPLRSRKSMKTAKAKGMNMRYFCILCEEEFINSNELGKHYAAKHPNTKESGWPCNKCPKIFQTKGSLYEHRRMVHKNLPTQKATAATKKVYTCLLCDARFGATKDLGVHYKTEHPDPEWTCPTCSKQFSSRALLYNHRRVDNNCPRKLKELVTDEDDENETDEKKNKSFPKPPLPMMPIVLVQQSFTSPLPIKGTLSSSDASYSEEDIEGVVSLSPSSKEKEMSFPCPFCPRKYRDGQDLDLHCKQDHPDQQGIAEQEMNGTETVTSGRKRWMCLVCDEIFPDQFTLQYHYKNEHPTTDTLKCSQCDKEYKRYSDLIAHKKKEHKDFLLNQRKKKRCREEDEENEDEEEYHPKEPEGTKPCLNISNCLLCDENFPNGRSLGEHYKTVHRGITSWECSICGLDFEGKSGLWYHKRSAHNGSVDLEKKEPSTSTTTDKLPTTSTSTSPKKKKAKIPNVCLICDAVRGSIFELKRHYQDVHGPNIIWKCFTCGIIFSCRNSLYAHRRDFHRDIPASLNHQPRKKNTKKTVVKSFPCSICKKVFASYTSLLYHKQHNHKSNQDLIVETKSGTNEAIGNGMDITDDDEEERVEVESDQN